MSKLRVNSFIIWFCMVVVMPVNAQLSTRLHKPALTTLAKDIFNTAVFIENKNVLDNNTGEDILYYSSHDYLNTCFTKKGLIYTIHKLVAKENDNDKAATPGLKKEKTGKEGKEEKEEKTAMISAAMVSMQWVGANADVQIIAGQQSSGYHTYLKKTAKGLTSVTANGFKTITYKNLYPGIDVVYSFPDKGGIEYTLLVQPGADVTQVRMAYAHDVKNITTDAEGNITLHTNSGDIIEHAPVTTYQDGRLVPSSLDVSNNRVSFRFPQGYDKSSKLIIDPWVTALTTLPTENMGFDIDYDFNGNLFVYGAGPTNDGDITNDFKVAEYGPGGNLLWTFNGIVPAITWFTYDLANNLNVPGNIIVDKVTRKIYVGKAFDTNGTTVIRLNTAGVYDNFVSVADPFFLENWGLLYKCDDGSVLALGGGTSSPINMGVVNTTTGIVSTSTITGDVVDPAQDIVCGVYDSSGSLYVIMNDGLSVLPYTNTIYKVNSTFTGNIWAANSNYTVFNESFNNSFWAVGTTLNAGNWFNCLAANGQYLFYYDGSNLAAYSLATGAPVGNAITVGSYTSLMQAGIAVDNCNHVYIGGVGVINVYTFNGTNFNANASIPLGGGFGTNGVNDIKYNSSNNLLYVTGDGFAGTYTATLSAACNSSSYQVAATGTCDSATVHISPSAALNPKIFNIIWTNSSGAVISQLLNTSDTLNTVNGLTSGTYTVVVQWNTNCGGSAVVDTVVISCNQGLIHSNDTTICPGQSAMLSATGTPAGGTYRWMPGNFTTSTITVTPAATTTYTVTYNPPTGAPLTAAITVTVTAQPVSVTVNNASLCPDSTAQLIATPTIPGGTYSWAPGGFTTQTISVTPATTTTYSVTYSGTCGSATGTGTVTVVNKPTEALTPTATTCAYSNGSILITAGSGSAPYRYALNNGALQAADSFTNLSAATYNIKVQDANGCSVTGTISVAASTGVLATLTATNPACNGNSGTIVVNATGGIAPYGYTLNGGVTQSIDTFANLATGAYVVKTTDATGCTHTDTAVLSGSSMVISLAADSENCFNQATAIITATVTGGNPGYSYSLNGGAGQTGNTFTQLGAGIYTLVATDAAGCTVSASQTVYQPTALMLDSLIATPVICAGQQNGTVTVYAHGGTPPYTDGATENSINFIYTTTGLLSGLDTGLYTIHVIDNRGCSVTGTVTVPTGISDSFSVVAAPTSCYGPGYSDGSVTIAALTGAGAPYTYALGSGPFQASGVFGNLAPGTYYPRGKDMHGCLYALAAITVPQPVQPTLTVYPTDTTLQLGHSVTLASTFGSYPGSSIVSYLWTPDLGLSCIDCPNPVATPYASQNTYQLIITYNAGCTVSTTVHVEVNDMPDIFIPNVFTPNGDGNNDVFYVYGANIKLFNLKIFNRWGEKVFETNNQLTGWDGTYKGVLQNPSVFTYEAWMILLDNTTINHKGSITLVR